jgi:hypothetical protein
MIIKAIRWTTGFWKKKKREQKIKSYYSPSVGKKFQHKGDYPISVRQPHKFSIETNLKQTCKKENSHTEIQNTSNIRRKITTHRTLCTKVWQEKNNFTTKNILLYSSQKDKTLNTFKKEVKNNGIGS